MKNNQFNDFSKIFQILSSGDSNAKKNAANEMVSGMSSNEKKELNDILNNKEKLDTILNSPAVRQILNKINTGNNGQHK